MRKYLFQFLALLSLGGVVFAMGTFARAQTVDELQQKITAQNAAIQKLEQEIAQYQGDLATLATKKKTLSTAIAALAATQKALEAQIKVTQTKVDTTDLKIRQISTDISYKEDEIAARTAALKESLLAIYESDTLSLPQVALSDESFSGFWNDLEALGEFSDSVNANIEVIKSLKADLVAKNKAKQTEKGKLLTLKDSLGDQKKITLDNKAETTKLLTQTKNQESQYQKILNDKLAIKNALEAELRDYESKLKFILDPKSIPPRGAKALSLPIAGLRIPQDVTQQFGKTVDSVRLYASGSHNGTDFRANVGTPVLAMGSGTVIGTGNTDLTCPGASYGKWVLVKHDNGLATLFGHFSLIKVTNGQTVNTGDLLGYSGNTGYSTGPHLHLTVLVAAAVSVQSLPSKACGGKTYTMPVAATNAYLNPLDYM